MTITDELVSLDKEGNIQAKSELSGLNGKKIITKAGLRRIEINDLPSKLPDFKTSSATKDNILADWLTNWIESDLKSGKIRKNDLLPRKAALASYIGISIGTVQTAIRFIEDKGYVESKQRIGTFIKDVSSPDTELRKQTSKRDQAIVALKTLISKNSYKVGEALPSSRELAKVIGSAPNTTRLALEYLAGVGIIESKGSRGNKANWILQNMPESSQNAPLGQLESDTLVDQVERDLKELIKRDYKINDKFSSHFELAEILKVSIKTVHDAMKRLVEQGILKSKRGRYGTFVTRIPDQLNVSPESSIFASAEEASLYNYEKVEGHLKMLIKESYKPGDKLPSMSKLASELKVSSNTIRKALQGLSEKNIVKFLRGRYGGTFVVNMPEVDEVAKFTWLSINPEHMAVYRNIKK